MLSSSANAIVSCASGLGIGMILILIGRFTPTKLTEAIDSRSKTEGRIRAARMRDEDVSYLLRSSDARGWRLATGALIGLTLIIVLTLWLGPVDLVWWAFLIGIFFGAFLVQLTFQRARAHQLRIKGTSRLDILPEAEQPSS